MRLFLLCLTTMIGGSIGDLFFAASVVFEPRGPQDDDSDKIVIAPRGAQVDNPSLGLGTGLPSISQVAENNIEENQEGPIISTDNRCRSPRAANRKRSLPDYCQDVPPLRSLQQENERPIGTFTQDKPAEGNYILPAKQNLEWAPPLRNFFETDPCQVRPWQVCAPYLPGLDFSAWSSGRLAGFDLEGCDYYYPLQPACGPPPPQIAGVWCCEKVIDSNKNSGLYPLTGRNCAQKGVARFPP